MSTIRPSILMTSSSSSVPAFIDETMIEVRRNWSIVLQEDANPVHTIDALDRLESSLRQSMQYIIENYYARFNNAVSIFGGIVNDINGSSRLTGQVKETLQSFGELLQHGQRAEHLFSLWTRIEQLKPEAAKETHAQDLITISQLAVSKAREGHLFRAAQELCRIKPFVVFKNQLQGPLAERPLPRSLYILWWCFEQAQQELIERTMDTFEQHLFYRPGKEELLLISPPEAIGRVLSMLDKWDNCPRLDKLINWTWSLKTFELLQEAVQGTLVKAQIRSGHSNLSFEELLLDALQVVLDKWANDMNLLTRIFSPSSTWLKRITLHLHHHLIDLCTLLCLKRDSVTESSGRNRPLPHLAAVQDAMAVALSGKKAFTRNEATDIELDLISELCPRDQFETAMEKHVFSKLSPTHREELEKKVQEAAMHPLYNNNLGWKLLLASKNITEEEADSDAYLHELTVINPGSHYILPLYKLIFQEHPIRKHLLNYSNTPISDQRTPAQSIIIDEWDRAHAMADLWLERELRESWIPLLDFRLLHKKLAPISSPSYVQEYYQSVIQPLFTLHHTLQDNASLTSQLERIILRHLNRFLELKHEETSFVPSSTSTSQYSAPTQIFDQWMSAANGDMLPCSYQMVKHTELYELYQDLDQALTHSKELENDVNESLSQLQLLSEREFLLIAQLKGDRSLLKSELVFNSKTLTMILDMSTSLNDNILKKLQLTTQGGAEWFLSVKDRDQRQSRMSVLTPMFAQEVSSWLLKIRCLRDWLLFMVRCELRLHCFYYLDLAFREGNYVVKSSTKIPEFTNEHLNDTNVTSTADPYVTRLSMDLLYLFSNIDSFVHTRESSFLWFGLDTLIDSLLVSNYRYIKPVVITIDPNAKNASKDNSLRSLNHTKLLSSVQVMQDTLCQIVHQLAMLTKVKRPKEASPPKDDSSTSPELSQGSSLSPSSKSDFKLSLLKTRLSKAHLYYTIASDAALDRLEQLLLDTDKGAISLFTPAQFLLLLDRMPPPESITGVKVDENSSSNSQKLVEEVNRRVKLRYLIEEKRSSGVDK